MCASGCHLVLVQRMVCQGRYSRQGGRGEREYQALRDEIRELQAERVAFENLRNRDKSGIGSVSWTSSSCPKSRWAIAWATAVAIGEVAGATATTATAGVAMVAGAEVVVARVEGLGRAAVAL